MTATMDSSFVTLKRREMIELAEGDGTSITCMTGSLWVTRFGSPEDVILAPGQSMVLFSKGSTVVQGLGYSTLKVTRPAARSFAYRHAHAGPESAAQS